MSRYLVTGGAGFIGSNFIRYLYHKEPKAQITNLDLLTYAGRMENLSDLASDPRYRFIHGDICDYPLVKSLVAEADVVVNFAAESHVDRSIASDDPFIRTNIQGTHTLLKAVKDGKVNAFTKLVGPRYVQISTDEVYGSITPVSQCAEEARVLNPTSSYAASKAAADLLAMGYSKTHNISLMITRSTNNYGPYQYPEKFIPLAITNMLQGKKVPLYDDGSQIRDWLHVEDNCRAIYLCMHAPVVGIVNIGYHPHAHHEITNLQLLTKLVKKMRCPLEYIEKGHSRKGHDQRYAVSIKRLWALFGWRPMIELEQGLDGTIEWYRQNEAWWRGIRDAKVGPEVPRGGEVSGWVVEGPAHQGGGGVSTRPTNPSDRVQWIAGRG